MMSDAKPIATVELTVKSVRLGALGGIALAMASLPVGAADVDRETLKLLASDLASLADVQITTATRSSTALIDAPAVVSVITADEIERRGYRTLKDALQHVPGTDYSSSSQFDNLTSRGISQTLTSFLLMIDGHAVNNKSAFGISVETLFPILSDVARIEIIRGAGSVLWGRDAGIGVINVITKTGRSLDATGEGRLDVSADYEVDHKRWIESSVYGKRFNNGAIMASLKTFDSGLVQGQGFARGAGGPIKNNSSFSSRRLNASSDFNRSYEAYVKGNVNDIGVKAAFTRFRNHSFDSSEYNNDEYNREWIDVSYSPRVGARTRIESRVFLNNFQHFKDRTLLNKQSDFSMFGGGAEVLAFYDGTDVDLTGGVVTEVNELKFLANFTSPDSQLFERTPTTIDQNYALIAEATYKGWTDWRFTFGARIQKDIGIINDFTILPRFAASYAFLPGWRAKYVFNTSEVAPTMELWRGGNNPVPQPDGSIIGGANDTQKYKTHDVQLIYTAGRTQVIGTLFYIEVEDMIQFLGGGTQRWANGTDATSRGFQVEVTEQRKDFKVYGNYTFAKAEFENRFFTVNGTTVDIVNGSALADDSLRIAGTPRHVWNVGADIDLTRRLALNLHHRGYASAITKWTSSNDYRSLGTETFYDASLRWRDVLIDGLDISVYAKNIFDNNAATPDAVSGGFVESVDRRRVGFAVKLGF